MKKTNRILSLVCSLVLVFSITAVPVAAADYTANQDPLMAAVLASDDCEIRYTSDGSARIITATLSSSKLLVLTRAANPYSASGTAYWNDPSEESFQCRSGWGKNCRVATDNVDDENNLRVTYAYVINGENLSTTRTAAPGDGVVAVIQSTNGADLTCSIDVTMTPTRGTTGLSADWTFDVEQY